MRFVAIIIIWVVLIGGLKLFLNHRQTLIPLQTTTQNHATGQYHLDITSTFTAKEDPFALQVGNKSVSSALVIQLGGKNVFPANQTIQAGKALKITPLPKLVMGQNEFYIEANPPTNQAQQAQAVRLRLFQEERLIKQKSFWSEPGARLTGTFTVTIDETLSQEHDDHDH